MKVIIKVKFGSPNPRIESFGNNRYLVYVSASRESDNEVNAELIAIFSKHFGVPTDRIELKKGLGEENKVFDIG